MSNFYLCDLCANNVMDVWLDTCHCRARDMEHVAKRAMVDHHGMGGVRYDEPTEVCGRYKQKGDGLRMGTNYYIRRKQPTIRETIHVCKRSFGWRTCWQETRGDEWPRWCDEDPSTERGLPHEIHSVEDIRAYLRTGDWELVDEYGEVYPDWETEVDGLVSWDGGKAAYNARNPDRPVTWAAQEHDHDSYRDHEGNVMRRGGFC